MSLSDKRGEWSETGWEQTESFGGAMKFYREQDVKEFIKELKEKIDHCNDGEWLNEEIDELVGDKLI